MLYNLLHYPVLVAYDQNLNEIEGIVIIKYHENSSIETMDPYYQKENAKFFSITGVLVKQRENMLNKGIGTNLYAASILGIQQYAQKHKEENFELNVVIDCTNLPSLYALAKGNENLKTKELLGKNKELEAILEAIYIVRDKNKHLVESPTYVIKIDLNPKSKEEEKVNTSNIFDYHIDPKKENNQNYKTLLDTIMQVIKQDNNYIATNMEDEGTGTVTYINVKNKKVYLESMKLLRNGAQNLGKKRVPRQDVIKFVGPMPDISKTIQEGDKDAR